MSLPKYSTHFSWLVSIVKNKVRQVRFSKSASELCLWSRSNAPFKTILNQVYLFKPTLSIYTNSTGLNLQSLRISVIYYIYIYI